MQIALAARTSGPNVLTSLTAVEESIEVFKLSCIAFCFVYISPTGCPLYGQQQWSTKKLWCCRVGMWSLSPIFILLFALLAFILILILVPIGVGYKVCKNIVFTMTLFIWDIQVDITSIASLVPSPTLERWVWLPIYSKLG